MVVGWEALIVLQDLRGLGPDEELDVTLWAARTLIRAALDDAEAAGAASASAAVASSEK